MVDEERTRPDHCLASVLRHCKQTVPHIPKGPLPAHIEEETWGGNRLAQVTWKRAVNMDVESCYEAAVHVLNHKTVTSQQVKTDHG